MRMRPSFQLKFSGQPYTRKKSPNMMLAQSCRRLIMARSSASGGLLGLLLLSCLVAATGMLVSPCKLWALRDYQDHTSRAKGSCQWPMPFIFRFEYWHLPYFRSSRTARRWQTLLQASKCQYRTLFPVHLYLELPGSLQCFWLDLTDLHFLQLPSPLKIARML